MQAGFEVPIFYDSMISKLITWGEDRTQAIARMRRALSEYEVRGIKTTIPFFQWMLENPDFIEGRFDTTYLDGVLANRRGVPFVQAPAQAEELTVVAAAIRAFMLASGGAAGNGAGAPQMSPWRLAARREALHS